jgi:hypothetical protein
MLACPTGGTAIIADFNYYSTNAKPPESFIPHVLECTNEFPAQREPIC